MNVGWRFTFVIAGFITIVFSFFIFWVMKDENEQHATSIDSPVGIEQQISIKTLLRIVLGSLSFWQIAMFAFFRYGTFVALQGLWLGTYLIDVKGFSPVRAGNILMMLSIGYIAGAPTAGYLADKVIKSAKTTAFSAVVLYALCLLPLTGIVEINSPVLLGALFSLIGFFNSPGTLAYTHVKELYPIHISGTVIAAANFFVMAGGAILTPALGTIIESITPKGQLYTPAAYHLAFLVCFLGTAASLIFYGFSKSSPQQCT
jgi:sugar phosphate permease